MHILIYSDFVVVKALVLGATGLAVQQPLDPFGALVGRQLGVSTILVAEIMGKYKIPIYILAILIYFKRMISL